MYDTVSILIPVYKTPIDKIIRCLKSIKYQTIDKNKLQVILVMDGTYKYIDKLMDICNELYPSDVLIKNISHSGTFIARYEGRTCVKSDIVIELDSDDYLANYACEWILHNFNRTRADLMGQCAIDLADGNIYYPPKHINRNMNWTNDDIKPTALWYNRKVNDYYIKVFNDLNLSVNKNYVYSEDVSETVILLSSNGKYKSLGNKDKPYYLYSYGGSTSKLTKPVEYYKSQLAITHDIIERFITKDQIRIFDTYTDNLIRRLTNEQ